MKHTKGPWQIDGNVIRTEGPKDRSFRKIATIDFGQRVNDYDLANAQLIAAAPELLQFARDVLEEQESHGENGDAELISFTRALIAKAEGR